MIEKPYVKMKSKTSNMASLRCVLFCFFGGIGCLFPYLPLHMRSVGISEYNAHIISIVAPLVAAIGPLFISPLADRLGGTGGRSMRILLAILVLLSAISYALLLFIPAVNKTEGREPAVTFICEPGGAVVLQERCMEPECYQWPENNAGPLLLSHCRYHCEMQQSPFNGELPTTTEPIITTFEDYGEPIEADSLLAMSSDVGNRLQETTDVKHSKTKRHILYPDDAPPHLCFGNDQSQTTCFVYTKDSKNIAINATFLQAVNKDDYSEKWCKYPLAGNFSCRIPDNITEAMGHQSCHVVCDLPNPYSREDSVLAQSQCERSKDNTAVAFWSYLIVRSIADIFPTTVVGLLDAAVIVATRETNLGRGDVGRELAFGSLGFAIFAPIVGVMNDFIPFHDSLSLLIPCVIFAALMIVCALFLFLAHSMPLNRPEWWSRHARVMPLGGLKTHICELSCFVCILVILGGLWSGIDSFLPWHLVDLESSKLLLGLTLTAGALPAIAFLWNSERLVEYCGHTNLLIIAFIFYIVRYAVYSYIEVVWWALLNEALEVFTMSLLWVTVLLYMRHLVPRHLTVTAQGMAVFFHFCIGRSLGAIAAAVISAYASNNIKALVRVYQVGAVISVIVASLYFIVYHFCLKCCIKSNLGQNTQNQHDTLQGPTSNGTYTPLRVYHNGSGQKEQQLSY